jgi:hypothetical protein
MSERFNPDLTPQLLDPGKITTDMKSLLRGRGPPYSSEDIVSVKNIMRMRLNASDVQDETKVFFIFSLSEKLIKTFSVDDPLAILKRVLPTISGVKHDNLEMLLDLWVNKPDQAERIQRQAAATPSSIPFRPITPLHQAWIDACNEMLDRITFNPATFPIARRGSSLGLGGVAVSTPMPTPHANTHANS